MYFIYSARRSAPISIDDIGTVHFKIPSSSTENAHAKLMRATISIDGPTIFIVLSHESENNWPFTIDNQSSHDLTFCQAVRRQRFRYPKLIPAPRMVLQQMII
jgi:hypothetical protein